MTQEEFSRRGGLARARKFTAGERTESARMAAKARWKKHPKKKAKAKVVPVQRKRRRRLTAQTSTTPPPTQQQEIWSA
jgi:hypothetical protein